jgi:hypothetical protein
MKYPLEYNKLPAYFYNGKAWQNFKFIPKGETIMLCAWCLNGWTKPIMQAGYATSHGLCESCFKKTYIED